MKELTVGQVRELLEDMPDEATFYMWGSDGEKRLLCMLKELNLNPDKTSVGMTIEPVLSMNK